MPRIIRRTTTRTRIVTPTGEIIEETPVVREQVSESDAVGLIGTDAVQLPTHTSVVEQIVQQPVVEQVVVEQPVQYVQQPAVVQQPVQYVQQPVVVQQPEPAAPVTRRVVRRVR